jgi:hypothetical protein
MMTMTNPWLPHSEEEDLDDDPWWPDNDGDDDDLHLWSLPEDF